MNRLFIELFLDEDVDVLVATLLRAQGFVAVTTQEARQMGNDDDEQLAYAVSQQQTLLTHNRDHFVALAREHFTTGAKHYGIIIAVRRPPQEVARRLLPILNQRTADEMEDQVRYI